MIQEIQKLINKLGTDQDFTKCDHLISSESPTVRLVHDEHRLIDLDKYLDQPRKLEKGVKLYQIGSFIKYIDQYKPGPEAENKHGRSVVFVSLDREDLSIVCKLDYHKSYDQPSFSGHEAHLSCVKDESFSNWMNNDNKWMSQKAMVNMLKRYSTSIDADGFTKLLSSIENVKSDTNFQSIQKSRGSESSSKTYFDTVEQFTFLFRPYCSIPNKYSANADLYVQIDDDGRVEFKYSIRNPLAIYEQVANDLRDEFNKLENVLVF